jgi:hypothetical protein
MNKENSNKNISLKSLIIGAIIGLIVSVLGNYMLVIFQNSASKKQMKLQHYLNEKETFVDACNEYLNRYRDWHELMNFYVYGQNETINEFDSINVKDKYINWKREFDLAYGKLLLISDNDFGPITVFVSDRLHSSLSAVINSDTLSNEFKEKILIETDMYFFKTWLQRAKTEIQLYNRGVRNELSLDEFNKKLYKELNQDYHKHIN